MTKNKYSINDLREVHFAAIQRSGGTAGAPRYCVVFHSMRKDSAIGRNDFIINNKALTDIGLGDKTEVAIMRANFPVKKIQIIFEPKGLNGPMKMVNVKKRVGGLSFGMGGLVEQFARENGFEITKDKNYFSADLQFQETFREGKMVSLELSLINNTVQHIHRD